MLDFIFRHRIRKVVSQVILELYVFNRDDQCWDIRNTRSSIDIHTMKELVDKIVKES